MRKELRPVHDPIPCDLCHRTILKGERTETFVGSGERQQVCELCSARALRAGWIRESELANQAPERERAVPRGSLWSRAVAWAEGQGLWGATPPSGERPPPADAVADQTPAPVSRAPAEASEPTPEPTALNGGAASPLDDDRSERDQHPSTRPSEARHPDDAPQSGDSADDVGLAASVARRPARTPAGAGLRDLIPGRAREPRDVHAVPTSRWGKIERVFELFNLSEHRRTIAGVGRTLGEPWVSAAPVEDGPGAREVGIVVAWELSWYRYRVDLDDDGPTVVLLDRGNELEDLDEPLRHWNVGSDAEGRLTLAVEAVS